MKKVLITLASLFFALSFTVFAEEAAATPATTTEAAPAATTEVAATPAAAASTEKVAVELKATRDVITSGVSNKEPEAEKTTFAVGEQATYFTEVTDGVANSYVTHVWKLDGKEMAKVELPVNASKWRTWSRKNLTAGSWTVEAVDGKGSVISTKQFTVTADAATPAATTTTTPAATDTTTTTTTTTTTP